MVGPAVQEEFSLSSILRGWCYSSHFLQSPAINNARSLPNLQKKSVWHSWKPIWFLKVDKLFINRWYFSDYEYHCLQPHHV